MIVLLLLAITLDTLPVTSLVPPRSPSPPASPSRPTHQLSPASAAAVQKFDDAVVAERSAFDALPAVSGIVANLNVRVALEQAMRRAVDSAVIPLSGVDRTAASAAIWRRIAAVDAANTAYVKSILPPDGWFRNGRDGADVARNAWLIVQHSPDQAFQRTVLARMRPLVASGEVRGADYALLYDRTEMFAGRPQLYGSQMSCIAGRWAPAPTLDPAGLDRRRADMGLSSMADYLTNFAGAC